MSLPFDLYLLPNEEFVKFQLLSQTLLLAHPVLDRVRTSSDVMHVLFIYCVQHAYSFDSVQLAS
jgi:hypothetical protein